MRADGSPEGLTVVLASIDARSTVVESVAAFRAAAGASGRVLLVDASSDGTAGVAAGAFPDLDLIRRPPGRLAPELWGDGLAASTTPLVAFSTAQMVPGPRWLAAMRDALDRSGAAGVGGPIAAGAGLGASDRALYLLRYAGYAPPLPDSPSFEPPGDNAIYRRDRLDAVASSWSAGFWEVEVHAALRALGDSLASAPAAAVSFRGGSRFRSAIAHRLAHARRYGAGRARGRGLGHRLARSLLAPAVPALLARRIAGHLGRRGEPWGPWLPALPGLAVLLGVWSLGESAGAWSAPARRA